MPNLNCFISLVKHWANLALIVVKSRWSCQMLTTVPIEHDASTISLQAEFALDKNYKLVYP